MIFRAGGSPPPLKKVYEKRKKTARKRMYCRRGAHCGILALQAKQKGPAPKGGQARRAGYTGRKDADMNKTEKSLAAFTHPEFGSVRTVELDREPWLVGKDVATALGYSDPADALKRHVDDEDKRILKTGETPVLNLPNRGLTIINESGLYSLVLSSKLPTARKFRRWVTSEVLPSIRRHGAYMTPDAEQQALDDPDCLYRLVTGLRDEHAARLAAEADRQALAEENEAARPKARFADAVADSDRCILVGDLAKLLKQNGLDIGAKRLFARLRAEGYLIRREGADYNMPTQKAMELGLFRVKETSIVHADGRVSVSKTPKVTGKGQVYFVNRYLHDPLSQLR